MNFDIINNMQMKFLYFSSIIAIFSLLLFSLASCSKEVTLDTGEEGVVVECILSCDSIQHLNLAFTHPKSQKSGTQVISEAQVTLFDETAKSSAGSFQFSSDNGWILPYSAIPQHSYRLDIDVPGHNHISAKQTMPKQVKVSGFVWSGLSSYGVATNYEFGELNHYWGTVFFVNDLPERTWISAISYNEAQGTYSIVDEICSDYPYIDNFNVTGNTYEPITVELDTLGHHLSYLVCDFLAGQPLHKKYLRTNMSQSHKDEWNYYGFFFSGSFYEQNNPNVEQPLGSKGGILFTTASEDYDLYLQESIYYQQLQESTDMSSIYVRDNVFSNIEGGVGIFGAKTQCLEKWIMKDLCYLQAGLKYTIDY